MRLDVHAHGKQIGCNTWDDSKEIVLTHVHQGGKCTCYV